MIGRQLDCFLEKEGYTKIPSNLPEFTIYFRIENNYVNVFHVIDYRKNLYISQDQNFHIKEKIKALFLERGITGIHILSLVIAEDMEKARQLCSDDPLCWIIDSHNRRLVIYEGQMDDFYGMKGKLEYFLSHLMDEQKTEATDKRLQKSFFQTPYITAMIIFINIVVFLICTFTGNLLYNRGAFHTEDFRNGREYYRIITSLFLHRNITHIASNMIVLYYLGEVVEKYLGAVRYGILYILTGIGGNLLSAVYQCYEGSDISSIGASGAVFGIIGALLILVIMHKGKINQITTGRLLFMISYLLYSGFTESDVNNAAHMGGFFSGMIIALILWCEKKFRELNRPK